MRQRPLVRVSGLHVAFHTPSQWNRLAAGGGLDVVRVRVTFTEALALSVRTHILAIKVVARARADEGSASIVAGISGHQRE